MGQHKTKDTSGGLLSLFVFVCVDDDLIRGSQQWRPYLASPSLCILFYGVKLPLSVHLLGFVWTHQRRRNRKPIII
jgi:hypothetical protein